MNWYMYTIHTAHPSAQLVSQQKSEGSMKAGHWEDVLQCGHLLKMREYLHSHGIRQSGSALLTLA